MPNDRNQPGTTQYDTFALKIGKHLPAIMLAAFALFFGMRTVFINADPPQDLSISGALYSDEGFKTLAARNMVLFGSFKWTPVDEYENWGKKSPVATATYVQMFRHFGTGFATIRSVSVIYSMLTILILYVFMLRNFGKPEALACCLMYGISFFTVMMNRTGLYETHMNFYLAACLLFLSEARLQISRSGINTARKISAAGALVAAGALCIVVCYFIKGSLMIIVSSMAPAAALIVFGRPGAQKRLFRLFCLILAGLFSVYLVLGHLEFMKDKLLTALGAIMIFGIPLSEVLPAGFLAPAHEMAGMSLYLEFIFLQPVIAFLGLFRAASIFHQFTCTDTRDTVRLSFASWLLFGFILLVMLKYHPSRYFHLFTVPLVIMAADALVSYPSFVRDCMAMDENRVFRAIKKSLTAFAVLYVPVVAFVQIVPFSLRNRLIRFVYDCILRKNLGDTLVLVIPLAVAVLLVIVVTRVNLARIKSALASPHAQRVLAATIIALQLFQFGRFMLFHESNMYEMSRQIGAEFPANAVIAGSWSANLCVENDLRPLVIQKNHYNLAPVSRIIAGKPFPVTHRMDRTINVICEKNIPLYLTLSPNVVFEQDTVRTFRKYLTPENLKIKRQVGYFDILVYRIK